MTALAIQIVAAAAGLALAVSVALNRLTTSRHGVPLPTNPTSPGPVPQTSLNQDMHTVLSLADRLKAVGCEDGVKLAKQLIDTMLAYRESKP